MRFLGMFRSFLGDISIWMRLIKADSVMIISIHVRQFVSVVPISARRVRHRLIVAASLLEKKADVLLTNDANVKDHRSLKEVGDDVNVEQEIIFKPRKDEKNPSDAHRYEQQREHNEAES